LHIRDLFNLLKKQIESLTALNGSLFNVGGGREVSVSLAELTELCRESSGKTIPIDAVLEDRVADIRIYLTDNTQVTAKTGWKPEIRPAQIIDEITRWITDHKEKLATILA
jgi:CDP-paratose 2-epimerase